MAEIWKDIKGYEGFYQVSNEGNVRSLDRLIKQKTKWGYYITKTYKGRILKKFKDRDGYNEVCLNKQDKGRLKRIARLVAEAFIPNPENKPQVDHIIPVSNGGLDNVENLRWVTNKENNNNETTLKNKSKMMIGKMAGEKHPFFNKKRPEHSKKISIPIVQINIETGEITEWESSKKCHETIGCSEAKLVLAINGKNRNKGHEFKGCLWYKKEEYDTSINKKSVKTDTVIV